MRILLFALLTLLFQACGSPSAEATATTVASTGAEVTTPTADPPATDPPCTALSPAQVAAALLWAGANKGMPTEMRDGRLQSCYFTSTDNVGAVTVTIARSNERIIENKSVKGAFASTLAKTDGKLKWREISADLGDQAIYGSGKTGPAYTYRLEWRRGNEVQYTIDASYYKEEDEEDVLNRVLTLARQL